MRDIVLRAGVEIVDAQHVVAFGDEPLAQVRAEKAGAARDENALAFGVLHDPFSFWFATVAEGATGERRTCAAVPARAPRRAHAATSR